MPDNDRWRHVRVLACQERVTHIYTVSCMDVNIETVYHMCLVCVIHILKYMYSQVVDSQLK